MSYGGFCKISHGQSRKTTKNENYLQKNKLDSYYKLLAEIYFHCCHIYLFVCKGVKYFCMFIPLKKENNYIETQEVLIWNPLAFFFPISIVQ